MNRDAKRNAKRAKRERAQRDARRATVDVSKLYEVTTVNRYDEMRSRTTYETVSDKRDYPMYRAGEIIFFEYDDRGELGSLVYRGADFYTTSRDAVTRARIVGFGDGTCVVVEWPDGSRSEHRYVWRASASRPMVRVDFLKVRDPD